jgi:hypothetical protein
MTDQKIVYDGRVSDQCAQGCVDGPGCGANGPYTEWCGGCCACRGGCRAGYYEQVGEGE